VFVVAVVGMMVVPMPTWLLDLLLTANLAASAMVLLLAVRAPSPRRLVSFPTLLLVAALVRVALGVSSTRLILLHADAGRVIDAFGRFVVSGNFVVGAVVFAVLTIVQYVVIARGAEPSEAMTTRSPSTIAAMCFPSGDATGRVAPVVNVRVCSGPSR
jgi:type III secretion protein V